jgi:hypothetical protein
VLVENASRFARDLVVQFEVDPVVWTGNGAT